MERLDIRTAHDALNAWYIESARAGSAGRTHPRLTPPRYLPALPFLAVEAVCHAREDPKPARPRPGNNRRGALAASGQESKASVAARVKVAPGNDMGRPGKQTFSWS